jgi:hypothetical protein
MIRWIECMYCGCQFYRLEYNRFDDQICLNCWHQRPQTKKGAPEGRPEDGVDNWPETLH